ncbi:hypothetical protein D3C80_2016630 [compost metagenome]
MDSCWTGGYAGPDQRKHTNKDIKNNNVAGDRSIVVVFLSECGLPVNGFAAPVSSIPA